jgi:hypothetical protein
VYVETCTGNNHSGCTWLLNSPVRPTSVESKSDGAFAAGTGLNSCRHRDSVAAQCRRGPRTPPRSRRLASQRATNLVHASRFRLMPPITTPGSRRRQLRDSPNGYHPTVDEGVVVVQPDDPTTVQRVLGVQPSGDGKEWRFPYAPIPPVGAAPSWSRFLQSLAWTSTASRSRTGV